MPTLAHAADPDLTVFDWAGFENQSLIEAYVAKNGDMPTYAFFGDDDEAFQKVSYGFKADVAHPCAQMVQKYRDAGLIEPWDVSKIPTLRQYRRRASRTPRFSPMTPAFGISRPTTPIPPSPITPTR